MRGWLLHVTAREAGYRPGQRLALLLAERSVGTETK